MAVFRKTYETISIYSCRKKTIPMLEEQKIAALDTNNSKENI